MTRPSRDEVLRETAFTWATRSTCDRLHVGCVIHRDGRIISVGYNGAPAGLPHCDPNHSTEECRAVHAEQNAIAYAAKHGVALAGASMVVTHQPCKSCAMSIINAGIGHVVFVYSYRLIDGLSLLMDAGIPVEKYIDQSISKVVE